MLMKRKKRVLVAQEVNITSLMDVLTVLLFFLIKIFTVNSMNITIPKDIILADSKVKKIFEESMVLAINDKRLLLNAETLLELYHGKFKSVDIMNDGRGLSPLYERLKKEMAKRDDMLTNEKGEKVKAPPGKLLIEVDKDLQFATLKYILHTATLAGYGDFQFLVRNGE